MRLSASPKIFALMFIFSLLTGCSTSTHINRIAYAKEMANLSDSLKYKGQTTVFWPYYQKDNALLFKIGSGGNSNINSSFYDQIDRTEALSVHAAFTSARLKAGFSSQSARKCVVYVCDDNGTVLCHADETGVHPN